MNKVDWWESWLMRESIDEKVHWWESQLMVDERFDDVHMDTQMENSSC